MASPELINVTKACIDRATDPQHAQTFAPIASALTPWLIESASRPLPQTPNVTKALSDAASALSGVQNEFARKAAELVKALDGQPSADFAFELVTKQRMRTQKQSADSYRDPKRDDATLRARLGVAVLHPLLEEEEEALRDFLTDVVGNIEWYEVRIGETLSAHRRLTYGSVVFGIVAIIAVTAVAFAANNQSQGAHASSVVLSQIGLLIGAASLVAKLLFGASDHRARLGLFWKASSDLKHLLYGMQQRWGSGKLTPQRRSDFLKELQDAVEAARKITEDERGAFFETFTNPHETLTRVTDTVKLVHGHVSDARTAIAALQQHLKDAEKAVLDAEVLEKKKAYLFEQLPEGTAKEAAKVELHKAEAETMGARFLLKTLRERSV
jgi:truncated hemoglobin YjbI